MSVQHLSLSSLKDKPIFAPPPSKQAALHELFRLIAIQIPLAIGVIPRQFRKWLHVHRNLLKEGPPLDINLSTLYKMGRIPREIYYIVPRLERSARSVLFAHICHSKQLKVISRLASKHPEFVNRLLREAIFTPDDDPREIDLLREIPKAAIPEVELINLIVQSQYKPHKLSAILKFPAIKNISENDIKSLFIKWLKRFDSKENPVDPQFVESIYLLCKTFSKVKQELFNIILNRKEFIQNHVVLILAVLSREVNDLIQEATYLDDQGALDKLHKMKKNYSLAIQAWENRELDPKQAEKMLGSLISIVKEEPPEVGSVQS